MDPEGDPDLETKGVNRRRLGIVLAIAVLLATRCAKSEGQQCMDDVNRRVGHSTDDDAFWERA